VRGIDRAGLGSAVDVFLSDRPMSVGVFEVHQEGGRFSRSAQVPQDGVAKLVVNDR